MNGSSTISLMTTVEYLLILPSSAAFTIASWLDPIPSIKPFSRACFPRYINPLESSVLDTLSEPSLCSSTAFKNSSKIDWTSNGKSDSETPLCLYGPVSKTFSRGSGFAGSVAITPIFPILAAGNA